MMGEEVVASEPPPLARRQYLQARRPPARPHRLHALHLQPRPGLQHRGAVGHAADHLEGTSVPPRQGWHAGNVTPHRCPCQTLGADEILRREYLANNANFATCNTPTA